MKHLLTASKNASNGSRVLLVTKPPEARQSDLERQYASSHSAPGPSEGQGSKHIGMCSLAPRSGQKQHIA